MRRQHVQQCATFRQRAHRDVTRFASTNATIGANLPELMDAPVRAGNGPNVYLRDIGIVENGTDIVTGYAHVNGKRTVYILSPNAPMRARWPSSIV